MPFSIGSLITGIASGFSKIWKAIGPAFLAKQWGKTKERLNQKEKTNEIIGKQRDAHINSVDDADRLFRDMEQKRKR